MLSKAAARHLQIRKNLLEHTQYPDTLLPSVPSRWGALTARLASMGKTFAVALALFAKADGFGYYPASVSSLSVICSDPTAYTGDAVVDLFWTDESTQASCDEELTYWQGLGLDLSNCASLIETPWLWSTLALLGKYGSYCCSDGADACSGGDYSYICADPSAYMGGQVADDDSGGSCDAAAGKWWSFGLDLSSTGCGTSLIDPEDGTVYDADGMSEWLGGACCSDGNGACSS